jgi:hypothetical protein
MNEYIDTRYTEFFTNALVQYYSVLLVYLVWYIWRMVTKFLFVYMYMVSYTIPYLLPYRAVILR